MALLPLAPVAILALAYAVRARTLSRSGSPVRVARVAAFAAGLAALAAALVPPLGGDAEDELFVAHMGQHLLLVDVAPALLLLGLTGPLLRPLLEALPSRMLGHAIRPWLALPIALALLVAWHVPPLFDAAVRHDAVHLAEHATFVAAGVLVWLPLLETVPAPVRFGAGQKLAFVVVWRLAQTVLGNVLLWAPRPLYDVYASSPDGASLEALEDQRLAAALMMGEGTVAFLVLAVWLGLRLLSEADRRQTLVEAGVHPRSAARAARFGR